MYTNKKNPNIIEKYNLDNQYPEVIFVLIRENGIEFLNKNLIPMVSSDMTIYFNKANLDNMIKQI